MADMQPPELHLVGGVVASVIPPPTAAAGVSNQVTSSETVGSKRQRRPSVRLGDIGGDSLYDPYSRKSIGGTSGSSKQWKQQVVDQKHKDSSSKAAAAFKTRALTDYTTETLDESSKELNLEKITIGSWRVKDTKKRAPIPTAKRVRSSWVTKIEEEEGGGNNNVEGDFDSGEDMDDDDGDGNSEDTPSKEDSHENLGDGNERNEREIYYNNNNHKKRSSVKSRSGEHHHNMSNHHHHQDGVELLSVPSETDTRGGGSGYRENNNEIMCGAGEDGVRIWLDNLGLGRYAPVFEIHEVDDEVLPMLTLEDLKDMGINAVGSRRKMFAAIQKLNKGFS